MLFALDDLGGDNTRRAVIDHISKEGWYEVTADDLAPTATSLESRYRIDLAWARKDAVLRDCINNLERNAWGLSRRGHDVLDRWIAAFRCGRLDLRQCEFFSLKLKQRIDPRFEPSLNDRQRSRAPAFSVSHAYAVAAF